MPAPLAICMDLMLRPRLEWECVCQRDLFLRLLRADGKSVVILRLPAHSTGWVECALDPGIAAANSLPCEGKLWSSGKCGR